MRSAHTLTAIAAAIMLAAGASYLYLSQTSRPEEGRTVLVVSTTTSLYDTGALDVIEDDFELGHGIDLRFISAGTGLAITHAKRGDADMILVHAPEKEIAFMEEGYGACRKIIAYNFFSIVGPASDPAGVRDLPPTGALTKLAEEGRWGGVRWVSRGDDSGTHSKERQLWSAAGFDPVELREEDWYLESGTGMGKTLQITEENQAYTLTDMGTYLKYHKEGLISLTVLVGSGEELLNVYSAIAVNPESNPDAQFEASVEFIKYLVSERGQAIIGAFGIDAYSVSLFNGAVELLEAGSDPELAGWIEGSAFWEGSECPVEYRAGQKDLYG